jgi:hypothetical protein
VRAFIEGVCWFVAGVVLWALTVTTITAAELTVAGITSAFCAALAVAARRVTGLRLRPTRAWLRWLALVPAQAVLDTARLAAWLFRGAHESTETDAAQHRRVAAGTSPTAVGTRAAAIGVISATPGSVVLDADDTGDFLVHHLAGGWPGLDERVTR